MHTQPVIFYCSRTKTRSKNISFTAVELELEVKWFREVELEVEVKIWPVEEVELKLKWDPWSKIIKENLQKEEHFLNQCLPEPIYRIFEHHSILASGAKL